MSLLFLLVGIACLVGLQMLRGALSYVFPDMHTTLIAEPEATRVGGLDLFEAAGRQLTELGFEGPLWSENATADNTDVLVTNHAIWMSRSRRVVVWLAPPVEAAQPNQLLTYLTTALADGRYAVTQMSDPYFSTVDDPRTPAQTVAPADFPELLEQHAALIERSGSEPTASGMYSDDPLHFANDHMRGVRDRLIERQRIRLDHGIARPTLSFALRLMRKVTTRPVRKPAEPAPIPAARLAQLATLVAGSRDRAPSQAMQWLLFAVSALLFVAIGWPWFGVTLTVILLGVIVFHEAGHWLAMRAFGYRNPHITLLPLLGGVTIGHEKDPSASKRAWVSLAGPLPGIIVGWVLVAIYMYRSLQGGELDGSSVWVLTTITLLFVNYLNVLPIPPLDGSHVLRALMPSRWIIPQLLAIAAGVALGIYVSWVLDFWLLAFIALLQLTAVRSIVMDARLLRALDRDPPEVDASEQQRTARVFEILEKSAGAPTVAMRRIAQANRVLAQASLRPMAWGQRLSVCAVTLVIVVLPAAGMAYLSDLGSALGSVEREEDADFELLDDIEDRTEEFAETALNMSVSELVVGLNRTGLPLPAPAGPEAIAAAEERLGGLLSDDLRELYATANGFPLLSIGPVEAITAVTGGALPAPLRSEFDRQAQLEFTTPGGASITVIESQIEGWWSLGSDEPGRIEVLVDPSADVDEYSVYRFQGFGGQAHSSVADILRDSWVNQQLSFQYLRRLEDVRRVKAARLEGYSIEALLDEYPTYSWWQKTVYGFPGRPAPASRTDLQNLEARLPVPLPPDHRELLSLHNGFPDAGVLGTVDIEPVVSLQDEQIGFLEDSAAALTAEIGPFAREEIVACWVVSGFVSPPEQNDGSKVIYPSAIWCPEATAERRYFRTDGGGFSASMSGVLRAEIAANQLGRY